VDEAILELKVIKSSVDQEATVLVVELVVRGVVGEGVGDAVAEDIAAAEEVLIERRVALTAVVDNEGDAIGEAAEGSAGLLMGVLTPPAPAAAVPPATPPAARAARR
jgi:hypothetical protein